MWQGHPHIDVAEDSEGQAEGDDIGGDGAVTAIGTLESSK
jgi:hypothetical protein